MPRPDLKPLALYDERAACEHPLAKDRSHHCPTCGGTLRRCCLSLIGHYPHLAGCQYQKPSRSHEGTA
jgi:hypothetical protein